MDRDGIAGSHDMSGRTLVVTGGAGVLGGEIAGALVGCGANVAILSRNPSPPDDLRQRLDRGPGRWIKIAGDVLDRQALEEAEEAVRAELGPADTLVNAAGGNHPRATTGADVPFFGLPADALRFVGEVNLLGTMLPCQVFGQGMAERGEGVILNVSSMNALRPLTRIPAYSAAKAAVSNFTQWLAVYMAQEHSPHIRVNALAPGFFLTDQNRFLLTDETSGELTPRGRSIIDHTPLGRFGTPEDLVGAALWLLGPASGFVTGVVLPVDGGFSAFGGV